MTLLAELRRRKVLKVGAAYLVVGWLVIEVAATILPQFNVPDWAPRLVTLLVALGLPIALVMAWVFDVTPGGVKVDASHSGSKRIFAIAGVLAVVVLGWYFYGQSTSSKGDQATSAPAASNAPASETPPAIPDKSIAVLAFADLSPQHDQDYFSDGIAEEILNALAQVKDLKVAGRTSSFSFKDKNEDLRVIGETLGVAHVLEGSVRKQGDKVRIIAQLIRSKDGFHLWSETYDGDLKDVFALQERIAQSIAEKLKIVLSGKQAEQLVNAGTSNPDAYALYLQATATFNRRDGARFNEAMAQLRKAVALDPKFARAYSRMATLETVRANYADGNFESSLRDAERYARQASALDPTLAEPHAALGVIFTNQRQYREGALELDRARALDPNDVTTNFWGGVRLIMVGYRTRGAAALDRTLQLDPLLPNALVWRARIHIADGELEIGARQLQRAAEGGHSFVGLGQYKLDLARGDRAAAIKSLTKGLTYFVQGFPPESAEIFARSSLGDAPAKQEAMRLIDKYLATKPKVLSAIVPFVLVSSGEVERGFALSEHAATNNESLLMSGLFSGLDPNILSTPAFSDFVRKIGLAGYWDEFGSPDSCRKDDSGEYACK